MTAEEIAERLRARRSGRGWMARCPAHEDRSASLSIGEGRDGRALFHCFAGCTAESVLTAIGVAWGDVLPPRTPISRTDLRKKRQTRERAEAAAWRIRDESVRLRGHYADALRRAERLCARMGERIMRAASDAEIENGWDALVRLGPALNFFLAAFDYTWDAPPDVMTRFILATPAERRQFILAEVPDGEIVLA
jgi:hypothetical protein